MLPSISLFPKDGVDEVYGAHLWNCALSGTVGGSSGSVTANSDSLDITVTGTGGHASAPQVRKRISCQIDQKWKSLMEDP